MIILSGTGANFGLPEGRPYVTKTEVHLRMAGLDYEMRRANPSEGPKGQVPFIDDGGRLVGDSTFIRMHIEREYGVDLDAGLSPLERAQALAIELMVDRELVQAVTYFRWMIPENFAKGPAKFFEFMPEDQREAFKADVLERVRASFLARGMGRHSLPEIAMLAGRTLDALVFATLAAAMTPYFDTPVREDAIRRPRLVAYVSRMMNAFYPDFEWDAQIPIRRYAA